mgnify:CR=1 FL=1|jgi:putative sigma-54 modulation protein
MKVIIVGRKVSLRDNFKELAKKKLARFDRIFEEDAEAKVVVTLEKNRQTVEITICSRGMIYRAESTLKEMNVALDEAIDSLASQIRRNKERLEQRKKIRSVDATALFGGQASGGNAEEEDELKPVRTKHFIVKPMNVEEAVLQMYLLEHQFFLFRNEETEEINVVYRRKDGGFGLLEPEKE